MAENENLEKVASAAQEQAPETPAKAEKAEKAEKKGEEKKSPKKSKPGLFARAKQWLKETKAELKKVQWPTWKQTLNNTLIVLAFCLVVGLCIFLFDLLAGNLFQALINLTH